jgi:hypothetical protein
MLVKENIRLIKAAKDEIRKTIRKSFLDVCLSYFK